MDALKGRTSVDYRRCAKCDLIFRNYPHSNEATNYYYEHLYRIPVAGRGRLYGRSGDAPFVNRKEAIAEYFLQRTALKPGSQVLDIGCADGLVLDYLRKRGMETSGVEPSTPMVNYAREVLHLERITRGGYSISTYVPEAFERILTHHVFEHVADIDEFLRAVSTHLRPGGYFSTSDSMR